MPRIEATITIDAPPTKTWDVLSDLTAMGDYMPGVSSVRLVSDESRGVGATRHCVFGDGIEVTERAREWEDGRSYTVETTAFKKVPMRSNIARFHVADDGGRTVVTQSLDYEMRGGPLAPLLAVMAKGKMNKALGDALHGLKRHLEG